jgi:hypothetical protein
VSEVSGIIRQSEDIHLMMCRHGAYLMESTDLIALVRRIWDTVAKVKNFHGLSKLVGAAGFEPTTSLLFSQGALTAELHAYVLLQMDGTHRINLGPMTFVHESGNRFHAATGN